MARKRTINRVEQRADFDEEEQVGAGEEEHEEEDESADEEGDEEAGEEEPVVKKKPAKKKAAAPKRTRTPKVVRMKAVWVIFDNSSKPYETFAYSERAKAEERLAELNVEKKDKGAYYLQMQKVKMDEE